MPKGLRRRYGGGDLHYITCSCYQSKPFLGSPSRRDLFLKIFEEVRQKYEFQVIGYVVMPEHFHLLIGEPDNGNVAVAMQVLKQRVSRQCIARGRSRPPKESLPPTFWLPRSYDFNVFTKKKLIEKLDYIHWNPVKRGLVASPEQWRWSSDRYYSLGEEGPVKITSDLHPALASALVNPRNIYLGCVPHHLLPSPKCGCPILCVPRERIYEQGRLWTQRVGKRDV